MKDFKGLILFLVDNLESISENVDEILKNKRFKNNFSTTNYKFDKNELTKEIYKTIVTNLENKNFYEIIKFFDYVLFNISGEDLLNIGELENFFINGIYCMYMVRYDLRFLELFETGDKFNKKLLKDYQKLYLKKWVKNLIKEHNTDLIAIVLEEIFKFIDPNFKFIDCDY